MGNLAVAMGARALRMYDSFGNALPGEMGQFVNQVEVLQQNGTAGSSCHGVLVVVNWVASRCSDCVALLHF